MQCILEGCCYTWREDTLWRSNSSVIWSCSPASLVGAFLARWEPTHVHTATEHQSTSVDLFHPDVGQPSGELDSRCTDALFHQFQQSTRQEFESRHPRKLQLRQVESVVQHQCFVIKCSGMLSVFALEIKHWGTDAQISGGKYKPAHWISLEVQRVIDQHIVRHVHVQVEKWLIFQLPNIFCVQFWFFQCKWYWQSKAGGADCEQILSHHNARYSCLSFILITLILYDDNINGSLAQMSYLSIIILSLNCYITITICQY